MANFDYLKDIREMQSIYPDCIYAEQKQLLEPDMSVVAARRALEKWVKIVYLVNGWEIPERAKLLELTDFLPFREQQGWELMRRIDYVRKIGNIGAHGGHVKKIESFFAVLNLYEVIGSYLRSMRVIEDYAPFDKTLIPSHRVPTLVPANTGELIAPQDVSRLTQVTPLPVTVTVSPDRPSEAETRRLYIDLMLREAEWEILETDGAINAGKACIEVELQGMPNDSGIGFADYVLFSDDMKPLAVIEAKRTSVDPHVGKHQAELYASLLEAKYHVRPVIYYSSGFKTYVQDGLGYPDREVFSFHSKDDLERIIQKRSRQDITDLRVNTEISGRYYQIEAIHSICHHLNSKHRRGLLLMATGTGKTRVSIGLTDILIRNNWAKNILFLADRRSLVRQAHKNYRKLLMNETTTILSESKSPNMKARIMFSTYQTMIRYIDSEKKPFSIGRFDLIIIDEAHRSVFGKYGSIFDYYDSLLIGLTATPKEDIEYSTYSLLELDEGVPNYSYEYKTAIKDGHLVKYRAFLRSSKIMTEGAKYSELSKEEKKQLEDVWAYEKAMKALDPSDDYSRDIKGSEIFRYLFNKNTIDQVLQDFMENGIRIQDGNEIGKTIIFAINHKHAQQIVDRFHRLYPHLGEDYCVLIDNQVNYGQDLIDIFCTPRNESQKNIQIVVSVDMMDTGIDVPDCLNLVFFKPVRSKIKFNQMIGRGTRLCPDIFGQGQDKTEFYIFDYCGNFEFFEENPEGADSVRPQSLSERLFNARLDLAVLLQSGQYQAEDYSRMMCEHLKDILHAQVETLNEHHIAVRKHWERVLKYKNRANWQYVSELEAQFLRKHLAPLIFVDNNDYAAQKFDLICLMEQLSLLDKTVNGDKPMNKIRAIGELLEQKASIPQVLNKLDTIREVQTAIFWEVVRTDVLVGLSKLERVREELRELVQYIIGSNQETFEINIKDIITDCGEAEPIIVPMSYRERVLDYLAENSESESLQKIYRMEQLSDSDIRELERIFWQELGTKEEYRQTYENQERYQIWGGRIAAFIRSIMGVDRELAREKYIALIQGGNLTPEQEEYLGDIIEYVCQNGDISRETMQKEPFSSIPWQPVFSERITALIAYVDSMHSVIEA